MESKSVCVKEHEMKWREAVNVWVWILIIYILNQSQWIFIKDDKTISNSFPIPHILGHAQSINFPFPTAGCMRID